MRGVAALSHPNIAAVYDWGIARVGDMSTAYVVNEYLPAAACATCSTAAGGSARRRRSPSGSTSAEHSTTPIAATSCTPS